MVGGGGGGFRLWSLGDATPDLLAAVLYSYCVTFNEPLISKSKQVLQYSVECYTNIDLNKHVTFKINKLSK